MKIFLSASLSPKKMNSEQHALDSISLGTTGFLETLETRLGIAGNYLGQIERVVQYHDAIRRSLTTSRFFAKSFEADPLGTAKTLLQWRDEWFLHGWVGDRIPDGGTRLQDMYDVERLAKGKIVPSEGERIMLVIDALETRSAGISEVMLLDPLDEFPGRWQVLLNKLGAIEYEFPVHAASQGLLGALQRHLSEPALTVEKLAWIDDGTIEVVRSESRLLSARWTAALLTESVGETLLVAADKASMLDQVIVQSSLPAQGLVEMSAFRPTLQVLPLTMQLMWAPLDVFALVEFLTHPVSPLPRYARERLAEKLARLPGVGGAGWEEALKDICERAGESADSVIEEIRFWIEQERYPAKAGVPLQKALDRVNRLQSYFAKHLAAEQPERRVAFKAGHAQCQSVSVALMSLQKQGQLTISRRQLDKLLEQSTSRGSMNPLIHAEVGCATAVDDPSMIWGEYDTVIWWNMTLPVLPQGLPWSDAEVKSLKKAGVQIPAVQSVLAKQARAWLKPIMAAQKRLVLVLPPENEEVHPVWQLIEAQFDRVQPKALEDFVYSGKTSAANTPIEIRPLPEKLRWWKLPEGVAIKKREKESFSSLDMFLNNPYQWVLKYIAKLNPSTLVTVQGEFLLKGSVAHHFVEAWLAQPNAIQMSDAVFDVWFDANFPIIIQQEAALMMMPGRQTDLERYRIQLRDALIELRADCAKSKIQKVMSEVALSGSFLGGELTGSADLVMIGADGKKAVVDMKWSGSKKYPKKLAENTHLQLATYAEMMRQNDQVWPHVGYYILDVGRMYALNNDFSLAATVVRLETEENTAMLWERFKTSWQWRRDQLDAGLIEVALEEIEQTDESVPPENGLLPEILNASYNNYSNLAGWEAK
jgi:RecB family exonuclease